MANYDFRSRIRYIVDMPGHDAGLEPGQGAFDGRHVPLGKKPTPAEQRARTIFAHPHCCKCGEQSHWCSQCKRQFCEHCANKQPGLTCPDCQGLIFELGDGPTAVPLVRREF